MPPWGWSFWRKDIRRLTTIVGHFRSSLSIGRRQTRPRPCLHGSAPRSRAKRVGCPNEVGTQHAIQNSYIFSPKWTIFNVRFSLRFCQSPENHQKWRIASPVQGFCSYPSKNFLSSSFGHIEWAYDYENDILLSIGPSRQSETVQSIAVSGSLH